MYSDGGRQARTTHSIDFRRALLRFALTVFPFRFGPCCLSDNVVIRFPQEQWRVHDGTSCGYVHPRVYASAAFDGSHLEFKMAGVAPVRGRDGMRRGVFLLLLYYRLFLPLPPRRPFVSFSVFGRPMNRKTAIIRRVADGRKREKPDNASARCVRRCSSSSSPSPSWTVRDAYLN